MCSVYGWWSNKLKEKKYFAKNHKACRDRAVIPTSLPDFKFSTLNYAIAFYMCYKYNVIRSQANKLHEPSGGNIYRLIFVYIFVYFHPIYSFMHMSHISVVEKIGPFLYTSKIYVFFRRNKIIHIIRFFPWEIKNHCGLEKGRKLHCNHF